MNLTTTEQMELGRCAQAMYKQGNTTLGHRLSGAAARQMLSLSEYDAVMAIYRSWLVG